MVSSKGLDFFYADDLKIFLKIRSFYDCLDLQNQLNWCSLNSMVVNPAKYSVITFSRKVQPIVFDYSLFRARDSREEPVCYTGLATNFQATLLTNRLGI